MSLLSDNAALLAKISLISEEWRAVEAYCQAQMAELQTKVLARDTTERDSDFYRGKHRALADIIKAAKENRNG